MRRGPDFDATEGRGLLIIVGVGCAGRHGLGGRLHGLRLPCCFPPPQAPANACSALAATVKSCRQCHTEHGPYRVGAQGTNRVVITCEGHALAGTKAIWLAVCGLTYRPINCQMIEGLSAHHSIPSRTTMPMSTTPPAVATAIAMMVERGSVPADSPAGARSLLHFIQLSSSAVFLHACQCVLWLPDHTC